MRSRHSNAEKGGRGKEAHRGEHSRYNPKQPCMHAVASTTTGSTLCAVAFETEPTPSDALFARDFSLASIRTGYNRFPPRSNPTQGVALLL